VTSEQPNDQADVDDGRTVAVYVATFLTRADVLRGECLIAHLSAHGQVAVLDAALVDWPARLPHPVRRSLQNLARLAALPVPVWDAYVAHIQRTPPETGRLLPAPATLLGPGLSGLIAFCTTSIPKLVTSQLERSGAQVSATAISRPDYEQLRYQDRGNGPFSIPPQQ
jgi:hypothetical protein